MELNTGNDNIELLLERIRGMASEAKVLLKVCCRLLNQDEETKCLYVGSWLSSLGQ